ncbi:GRB10-interacting GYF protein 2 [Drosophila kikkawai]|uniref:GRB10-interacting GYF protein 2 n=1 Tax=Drosophila kikkawai TaxID=30033 RepID=A0A6P4IZU3_DROKI|nr:bromodomain-containing protein DDB_G0280777 [Drosophila kikkawai]
MGVIYKILKQQRQQHHRSHHLTMDLSLSSTTRCKVQAAIKQRQQHRLEQSQELEKEREQHQEPARRQEPDGQCMEIDDKEELAEQQLQQLCRFLADNAARKKRQRFKLQYQDHDRVLDQQREQELEQEPYSPPPPHEMAMEFIDQLQQSSPAAMISSTSSSSSPATAPRDSILLKIRHQIFERKRQRQRQLAELVQQRLVVWRPW